MERTNKPNRGVTKKTISIIVGVVIIVAAFVGSIYALSGPLSFSFGIASSTSVGTAGESISFTILPSVSGASINTVTWYFGDGTNKTVTGPTTTHTYTDGGYYLVYAQVSASYFNLIRSYSASATNNLALFPLQVQANLTQGQAQNASVPTINFQITKNPTAPIFNAGDTVYPVGGFLQPPGNGNWSIQTYSWNFANGKKAIVAADVNSSLPVQNVTTSYSSPGLYPLSVALTTNSSVTGATFEVTTIHTVAVKSPTSPFAILTGSGGVVNPGIITSAEVAPGGPYSWDPQTDYDIVGYEELQNIFQQLVQFSGSSTSNFIPVLAAALPAVGTGITPDYKNYTFTIRSNQYFSNGDPVTAYDVWFSFARNIAFAGGSPGTPDWIQAQFLVPGVENGSASVYSNNTWSVAETAVTYSNTSNTVTFHFNRPVPPTVAFQVLADPEGAGIVDAKYAASVGASFQKSDGGFTNYMNEANSASYNTKMEWSPVGSGPYMVQSRIPGQSVELVPNPYYKGVPGIPPANDTVVIDWVKTPDTALLMLQDGQADSVVNLPTSDFPAIQQLQSKGLVRILNFPTLTLYFYGFNINVNKTMEATQFGSQFNEPYNYFADLPTRMAWINAYDYQGYLNNILGNAKYGASFGRGYQGAIPPGMIYFVPPSELGGLPAQNLKFAMDNFSISAWADSTITIPIIVPTGDPINLAAANDWAATLGMISQGHITAKVLPTTSNVIYAAGVPNLDPIAVANNLWAVDYPDPADYVNAIYQEGGTYPNGNNWLPMGSTNTFDYTSGVGYVPTTSTNSYWIQADELVNVANTNSTPTTVTQATAYTWLNGNITLGDTSVVPAVRQTAYKISELLAIDMGLYVYVYNAEQFDYMRSWLGGIGFPLSQENPVIGSGGPLLYYYLAK